MSLRSDRILWLASMSAVLLCFQFTYGLSIVVPTNVSWLMSAMHDWGTHYLGWFFYRNEPWHFPLGAVHKYFYPLGTNVGFTDSIPLLAIFFKIFSRILPEDFQYFGLWLLACHFLVAIYTIRICKCLHIDNFITFIAVVFITLNPVLIYRGIHPALCAHWLLLGSLYYYIQTTKSSSPKYLNRQFVLLLLAASINPYLCAMVFGFSVAICFNLFILKKSSLRKTLFYLGKSFAGVLAVFVIIGLVRPGTKENLSVEGGYGLYSLNLNTLFNPAGYKAFLPTLPQVSWHQYEGYMYIGSGILFICVVLLLAWLISKLKKGGTPQTFLPHIAWTKWKMLILLYVFFILFALTNIISLNDKIVLHIPLPSSIVSAAAIFRASARFFWPVYYTLIFLLFYTFSTLNFRKPVKIILLLVALSVQFVDTKSLLFSRHLEDGAYTPPLSYKAWTSIFQQFQNVAMYPPHQATYISNLDYQFFCFMAAEQRRPINTGYVARSDDKGLRTYLDSLETKLSEGILDTNTVYITTQKELQHFYPALQGHETRMVLLDNYIILCSTKNGVNRINVLAAQIKKSDSARADSILMRIPEKIIFSEVPVSPQETGQKIKFNVGKFLDGKNFLNIGGWAFRDDNLFNKADTIFITAMNGNHTYVAKTEKFERPDIAAAFNNKSLSNAGFNALIFKDGLPKGNYKLGIQINSSKGEKLVSWNAGEMSVQ